MYVRTPEGLIQDLGKLFELKRALYGLRDAALLWYKHLRKTLTRLGLKPVPGVPFLYTNTKLIVFFFIDDIVVLVHPLNLAYHAQFKKETMN
jgi:hypothetical protein